MYQGFFMLGGVEIANAARVEAYVRNLLPSFPLKNCMGCDEIGEVLGHGEYTSPINDNAEWVDTQNPATYDFLGFYPTAIRGMQSATTEATVVQSIGAGGYNNIPRDATRDIRVTGVMIASTALGLDAGMAWLREALQPPACGDHGGSCAGATMCYFAACPQLTVCYEEEGEEVVVQLNNLTQASGLLVQPNTLGVDQKITGILVPTNYFDGFTFMWGVSPFGDGFDHYLDAPIAKYGPVTPQRTNVVRNPHFTLDTALWTTDSAAITRVAAGASDGGAYGQIVPTGTGLAQTSIAAAPAGMTQLQFEARTPDGASTFKVNIRAVSDDSLIQTQTFNSGTDWNQYTLAVPFARENYLEFETTVTLDISLLMLEGGTIQFPYFDGDTLSYMQPSHALNAPSPEYEVSWLGDPHLSASRMMWLGEATYSMCGEDFFPWLTVTGGTGELTLTTEIHQRVSAAEQGAPYERYMHDVTCISGPTITRELGVSAGAAVVVDFLLSAATPYAYSAPSDLLLSQPLTELPHQTWVDLPTPETPSSVIVDPDCPPVPDPPRPPAITNSCVDGPGVWDRYFYTIPAEEISAWSKMLPTVALYSGDDDIRQVRVRLTPNPFGWSMETGNMENLATNPSGEAATTGYTAVPGTTGVAAVTNPTATTAFGTKVIRTTWSTASTAAGGGTYFDVAVTAGTGYNFGFNHVKASIGNRLQFAVEWRTSVATISTVTASEKQVTGGTIYDTADFSLVNQVAPPTATIARVKVLSVSGTGYANWSIGSYLELDGLMANEGTALQDYFDGSTQEAGGWFYGWEGTEGLSASLAQESLVDPYSWCAEFILSYLPADAELVVDGTVSRAWASVGGAAAVPAMNLLYGTDGDPIIWPEASCGVPYLLTVDVPVGEGDDVLLSLSMTRRG